MDPNEEMQFGQVYMTGLEYSVYSGDWKMAILFFVHSADPAYNCFDGTITETYPPMNPEETFRSVCKTHPAFIRNYTNGHRVKQVQHSPLSGFKGLYCLIDKSHEESSTIYSSLWLMETCHSCKTSLAKREVINYARQCLIQIGASQVWNNEFASKVLNILKCLHRLEFTGGKRIPNDISTTILEYILDDVLLDTIWEGLRYTSDCAANP